MKKTAFAMDGERVKTIQQIVGRVVPLWKNGSGKDFRAEYVALVMCALYNAKDHGNGSPLDLESLVRSSDTDLLFDVMGSLAYFNVSTNTFRCGFVPRCGFLKKG